jgi:hypothetical protein
VIDASDVCTLFEKRHELGLDALAAVTQGREDMQLANVRWPYAAQVHQSMRRSKGHRHSIFIVTTRRVTVLDPTSA